MERAVVLIECADQLEIIARVSEFIFQHGANIIQSDQYSTDPENGEQDWKILKVSKVLNDDFFNGRLTTTVMMPRRLMIL